MDYPPTVSVIIPTFNRKAWLRETLASLTGQTYPHDQFEVLVVNDGSTDGTEEIEREAYPFQLRYLWQTNQGDAIARNLGARHSQGEILVFLDDDIILEKDYLSALLAEHEEKSNRVVVGTDILWLSPANPLYETAPLPSIPPGKAAIEPIPFAEVCSNNMSIRREVYVTVGMMESLNFPGSSIWCDVDFSYRAYQKGVEFVRSHRAFCWHRDYVSQNLNSQIKRAREAAYRAVILFKKYPGLVHHLPMFTDKTPVDFRQDSGLLIIRKIIRRISSSHLLLVLMEKMASALSNRRMAAGFSPALERWIVGGHIFQGYWKGLREFGPVKLSPNPKTVLPERDTL